MSVDVRRPFTVLPPYTVHGINAACFVWRYGRGLLMQPFTVLPPPTLHLG